YQFTRNILTISNGAIGFDQYTPTDGISEESDLNSITYDIWNHVVFSQDSSAWFLSIGGIIVSSANGVEHYSGSTPEAAWVGGRKYEVQNPSGLKSLFHGLIDDLRIYNRALSAAEVQALYQLGQ
ncbi:MAG: LamG-like jellyroll fold domain-containing protein, partial [Verrucomicrobiota bacterium]|nr:LamG-like jellyroll fold domain-containing protein [Verrucomicrobiota bacterium]